MLYPSLRRQAFHPTFQCGRVMRAERDYEARSIDEDQRKMRSGGGGLPGSHTDLFHCLGLVALLQSSVGDQGKGDDDYGNEQALFLKD